MNFTWAPYANVTTLVSIEDVSDLPTILQLEAVGDARYAVANAGDASTHNVLFGGQVLAQTIMAAAAHSPDKTVKTIHTIFSRAGRVDAATELEVDTFHAGRAVASHTITVWQGDRLCARSSVLAHRHDDDFISHQMQATPGDVAPANNDPIARDHSVFPGAEYSIANGVDLMNSDAPSGPPELTVRYRLPGAPTDPIVNQAVLAWGTDGFLIGTAMRPHAGVAYDRAHVDIATGVISHTLTFHRPFSIVDWVTMTHTSPFTGGGRGYGQCHVHDASGQLVASFVQDCLIRPM